MTCLWNFCRNILVELKLIVKRFLCGVEIAEDQVAHHEYVGWWHDQGIVDHVVVVRINTTINQK